MWPGGLTRPLCPEEEERSNVRAIHGSETTPSELNPARFVDPGRVF